MIYGAFSLLGLLFVVATPRILLAGVGNGVVDRPLFYLKYDTQHQHLFTRQGDHAKLYAVSGIPDYFPVIVSDTLLAGDTFFSFAQYCIYILSECLFLYKNTIFCIHISRVIDWYGCDFFLFVQFFLKALLLLNNLHRLFVY